MFGSSALPKIHQDSAQVGILHTQRAVNVPGVHNPALAAAWLVQWQAALQFRVVERLHFPSDDAVLDVDHPRATAGAVDPVRASYDFIVLPAVAIELFPKAQLWIDDILDPAQNRTPCPVALIDQSLTYGFHAVSPQESRECHKSATQKQRGDKNNLGIPLRFRFRFSLFEERHQIGLLVGGERMHAVNGSHDLEVESLHRRLRPSWTKFPVGLRQIGPQRPSVRKGKSRDAVAGDARGPLIAKMSYSSE